MQRERFPAGSGNRISVDRECRKGNQKGIIEIKKLQSWRIVMISDREQSGSLLYDFSLENFLARRRERAGAAYRHLRMAWRSARFA